MAMTQIGFREYAVAADEFTIGISVEAEEAPYVANEVTFFFCSRKDPSLLIEQKIPFQTDSPTRKRLALEKPAAFATGDILFTITAVFPNVQPKVKPYTLRLESVDGQTCEDFIHPNGISPVRANYTMRLRS